MRIQGFTPKRDMNMQWMIPYQAGELNAISSKAREDVATEIVRTAGLVAKVSLSADRQQMIGGNR